MSAPNDTDIELKTEPFSHYTSPSNPKPTWACSQVVELITKGFSRVSEII